MFVDNCGLFRTIQAVGGPKLDYKRLKDWVVRQRDALIVRYYCGEGKHDAAQRSEYYSVLRHAGYEVVVVPQQRNPESEQVVMSTCHLNMACDMIELALTGNYDTFIVLTGAGEFVPILNRLQLKGLDVEIVFFEFACDPALRSKASLFRALDIEAVSMDRQRMNRLLDVSKPLNEKVFA